MKNGIYNFRIASKYGEKKIDTVADAQELYEAIGTEGFAQRNDLIMMAMNAWDAQALWRNECRENKNFLFKTQWLAGEMNEIHEIGGIPLQNNILMPQVVTLLGTLDINNKVPICIARTKEDIPNATIMTAAIGVVDDINERAELMKLRFMQTRYAGMSMIRIDKKYQGGKIPVAYENVSFEQAIIDPYMRDPRGTDCTLIGQLHNMSLNSVKAKFAKGSKDRANQIGSIYNYVNNETINQYATALGLSSNKNDFYSFFMPNSANTLCRVIELWRRESKERLLVHDNLKNEIYKVEVEDEWKLVELNKQYVEEQTIMQERMNTQPDDMQYKLITWEWIIDNYWYYYFLSPMGDVLDEGETPYWHEEHPYELYLVNYIDGEVYAPLTITKEHQRLINQMLCLVYLCIKGASKNLTYFDINTIPNGETKESYVDKLSKINAVVAYDGRNGVYSPPQTSSSGNNIPTGTFELLNLMIAQAREISSISGALQGRPIKSGEASSAYAQESINSSNAISSELDSFINFQRKIDMKVMKVIQQYCDEEMLLKLDDNGDNAIYYTPEKVKYSDFDIRISEGGNSPVARMMTNNFLMQLFQAGAISIDMLLESGNFDVPKLQKMLQEAKQQMEQQAQLMQQNGEQSIQPMQVNPELQQYLDSNSNPQVMQGLQDFVNERINQ